MNVKTIDVDWMIEILEADQKMVFVTRLNIERKSDEFNWKYD